MGLFFFVHTKLLIEFSCQTLYLSILLQDHTFWAKISYKKKRKMATLANLRQKERKYFNITWVAMKLHALYKIAQIYHFYIYMKIKKNHYTALIKVSQKSQTTCVYIAHKLIQTCSSQITLREFRIQPKISLYG